MSGKVSPSPASATLYALLGESLDGLAKICSEKGELDQGLQYLQAKKFVMENALLVLGAAKRPHNPDSPRKVQPESPRKADKHATSTDAEIKAALLEKAEASHSLSQLMAAEKKFDLALE